jgi:hypothetical protein
MTLHVRHMDKAHISQLEKARPHFSTESRELETNAGLPAGPAHLQADDVSIKRIQHLLEAAKLPCSRPQPVYDEADNLHF